MTFMSLARCSVVLSAVAFLSGCGRDDIQVYRVAKEPAQPTSPMTPGGNPAEVGAPQVQWRLPAGWEEVAPGQMRLASFRIAGKEGKQADVGIFPLPGLVGHELETVNRWRETVGQPPVTEADLGKLAQTVVVGGQSGRLYEQAGENPGSGDKTRILAVIHNREEITWFFKMTGDDALVAQQKPVFIEFLKSLSFGSGAPSAGSMMGAMPSTGMPAAASEDKPQWQVPEGWREMGGSQFLVDKFVLSGEEGSQAAVNVSASAGSGGGLAANVNRWRGQLGLGPWDEAELNRQTQTIDLLAGKGTLIQMTGIDPKSGHKTRVVGVMTPQGNQTWFYKLAGDDGLVEKQKPAFIRFVQSVKYTHGS